MKGLSFIALVLSIVASTGFQKPASSRGISSNALASNALWECSHRSIPVGPHHHGRSLLQSKPLIQRSASETYSFDSISSAIATKAGKVLSPIRQKLAERELLPELPEPVVATFAKSGEVVRQSWFLSPMFLALVPLYCALVTGTFATMPEWWSMMRIPVTGAAAMAAVALFLFSNISFFVAAYLLMMWFPPRLKTIRVNSGLPIPTPKKMKLHIPTEKSMLGVWMLISGLISTIFHSVQAYGPHPIAESLCFIDHAIAGSALFYFWRMCGNPSKKVWAVGLTSFAFLCITSPTWIYTWCHSMWHVIASFAAVLWVRESHKDELARNGFASEDVDISAGNPLSTNYGTPQVAGRKRVPPVTEIAKFLITATAVSARLNRNRHRP